MWLRWLVFSKLEILRALSIVREILVFLLYGLSFMSSFLDLDKIHLLSVFNLQSLAQTSGL